jgi:hypothetical protein
MNPSGVSKKLWSLRANGSPLVTPNRVEKTPPRMVASILWTDSQGPAGKMAKQPERSSGEPRLRAFSAKGAHPEEKMRIPNKRFVTPFLRTMTLS